MRLFRVFPYDESAAPTESGGALFVPPSSGRSRIDNRDLYSVFYAATDSRAAVAESFGQLPVWRPETFEHGSGNPYALATLDAPDVPPLFELNDVDALRSIGVARPTDVVTRDRDVTQGWARKIFEQGGFSGARWWSYYNPDWPIVGLWSYGAVSLAGVPQILSSDAAVVREAAAIIVRQIARSS